MFGAAGGVNIRWVGLRFPPRVYAVPGELLVKIAPRAGPGQGYEGHKSSLLQLLTIPSLLSCPVWHNHTPVSYHQLEISTKLSNYQHTKIQRVCQHT